MYIAKQAPMSIPETFHLLMEELRLKKNTFGKTIIYCRSIKGIGLLYQYYKTELKDDFHVSERFSRNCLVGIFHRAT